MEYPTFSEAMRVLENLRESSHAEMMAGRPDMSVRDAAKEIFSLTRSSGRCWVALTPEGSPASIFGYAVNPDGTGSIYGYVTSDWPKIWREVTACIVKIALPAMWVSGVEEAYAGAVKGYPENDRWLCFLGGKPVQTAKVEDLAFTIYAWEKERGDV